jgi:hypothetical protein
MQVVDSDGTVCVAVIVPSGALTRFVTFELSVEGVFVPTKSTYARNSSSSPAWNRNEGIRRAGPEITHFFFIDDDHTFDQELIMHLLNHKLELVCCLTWLASPPFHPVLFKDEIIEHGKTKWINYRWSELDGKSGLFGPVWAVAGAGILVARTLTDRMKDPWFALGQYPGKADECNEDMYFYDRVREAGVPIMVDLDARLGHTNPCTAYAERDEQGLWYIILVWENGERIKLGIRRGDRPDPQVIPLTGAR